MIRNVVLVIFAVISVSDGVVVSIDWSSVVRTSQTTPALQVVVNPMIRRGSPIHDNVFANLKKLGADYVRFVPWLPYPQLAVAELTPPTGTNQCATVSDFGQSYVSCLPGKISAVRFASYGTSTGQCGNFTAGWCAAANTTAIIEQLCIGQGICTLSADWKTFGDPCYDTLKHLTVEVECSGAPQATSWNFTLIDPLMEDFINATDGSVIINFSTIPQWMFNTPTPVAWPTDPNQPVWNYEQGTEFKDWSLTDVSNYYERLVAWYTNGGFYDEFHVWHGSGHFYDIPIWEVLNEIEGEHAMSSQLYAQVYDAIVTGIRKVQPNMKFMGLALEGHNEFDRYEYFLNKSNHQPGIPLDYISFHFYASPSSRTDIRTYDVFFSQAAGFVSEVAQIVAIRDRLSPDTKLDPDEVGVILPDDNDENAAPIPKEYWNAAGAMYAYLFGELALLGVDVIGESQFVGYPTQYPSVSEVDWTTGNPNARYWVLQLLIQNFAPGDALVATNCSDPNVFALGVVKPDGTRCVLLVNKLLAPTTVELAGTGLQSGTVVYSDITTAFDPPAQSTFSGGTIALGGWSTAVASSS
eukprot:TRINITY_DN5199_c0_g1_i1.p1 TRINITY_DN5199_c0_g1~~TRINITY_DN5199_c0_g1_i1.p1  ORF type:complete len:580 (+),score=185.42 TRINITY_DN5199_c0_g1_i1:19-1758(+)